MTIIKFSAWLTLGSAILLLLVFRLGRDPDVERYKETVAVLMLEGGLSSIQEAERIYPALKIVRQNMDRIAELSESLLRKSQHPAPVISVGEELQMEHQQKLVKQLRKQVRAILTELASIHSIANHEN